MINKLSHTSIYVLDQESAKDFYVNKLGFNVETDAEFGEGMRWLTVTPPDQPDLSMGYLNVKTFMQLTRN
jgi:catechol 2,3-dioxygenase-like lactoylglutathione lyase family enzyme